jgi:hypothetical protein
MAGQCLADKTCACDAQHGGSYCQYRYCDRSNWASYLEVAYEFAYDPSQAPTAMDAFLASNDLVQLQAAIANVSHIPLGAVCLVDLSDHFVTTARALKTTTLYPIFELNPLPQDPYACNMTCPEATAAANRTIFWYNNANWTLVTYPLNNTQGVTQITVTGPLTCRDNCTAPDQGLCHFGTCICTDQWKGPSCAIPACPGEPDCTNNGICLTNYTTQPYRRCLCNANWTGTACDIGVCPLNCTASLAHGFCDSTGTVPRCQCYPGYQGLGCETNVTFTSTTGSTASLLRWLSLGFAAGAIVASLLLCLSLEFIPPLSRLFFGKEGYRVRNIQKTISHGSTTEERSIQLESPPPPSSSSSSSSPGPIASPQQGREAVESSFFSLPVITSEEEL